MGTSLLTVFSVPPWCTTDEKVHQESQRGLATTKPRASHEPSHTKKHEQSFV
jgi:hypothetical protein